MQWVQSDGPWLIEIIPKQNLPEGTIEVGHFDAIHLRVGPVDVSCDPVTGEPVRRDESDRDDIGAVQRPVQRRPLDATLRHVRPKDDLVLPDEVQRRRVLEAGDDERRVARTVRLDVDSADVVPVGEQQLWHACNDIIHFRVTDCQLGTI